MSHLGAFLVKSGLGMRREFGVRVVDQGAPFWVRPRGVGDSDPRNVGTQLLAGDGAIGGTLDGGAAVFRDWPDARRPLADGGPRNPERTGYRGVAASERASMLNG